MIMNIKEHVNIFINIQGNGNIYDDKIFQTIKIFTTMKYIQTNEIYSNQ